MSNSNKIKTVFYSSQIGHGIGEYRGNYGYYGDKFNHVFVIGTQNPKKFNKENICVVETDDHKKRETPCKDKFERGEKALIREEVSFYEESEIHSYETLDSKDSCSSHLSEDIEFFKKNNIEYEISYIDETHLSRKIVVITFKKPVKGYKKIEKPDYIKTPAVKLSDGNVVLVLRTTDRGNLVAVLKNS